MAIGVSFDLWNTLVSPNPDFKIARTTMIADIMNTTYDIAERAFSEVHKEVDDVQERLGICLPHSMIINSLVTRICHYDGFTKFPLTEYISYPFAVQDIKDGLEDCFNKYPPIIMPEVVEALDEIASKATVGIISNTSFVIGGWLQQWLLATIGVDVFEKIKFFIWSDQHGQSKPHPSVFVRAKVMAGNDISDFTHVGDNIATDGACASYGFSFVWTPNPNKLPEVVQTLIHQKGL